MSRHTLNNVKFDSSPLTLFVPDNDYQADEMELKQSFQRNREMMERLQREFYERKMSGQRIV